MPWRSSPWPPSLPRHSELAGKAKLRGESRMDVESLEKSEGGEHHEGWKPE
jgi:hypothetical protein